MTLRRYSIPCAAALALLACQPLSAGEPSLAELESRADQAVAASDLAAAVQVLERLRFEDRLSVPRRLALAKIYLRLGRAEEALAEVQTALAAEPTDLDGLTLRGEIAATGGDWGAARDAYRVVAQRNPTDPGIHLRLGQALQELGEPIAADAEFGRYVELSK